MEPFYVGGTSMQPAGFHEWTGPSDDMHTVRLLQADGAAAQADHSRGSHQLRASYSRNVVDAIPFCVDRHPPHAPCVEDCVGRRPSLPPEQGPLTVEGSGPQPALPFGLRPVSGACATSESTAPVDLSTVGGSNATFESTAAMGPRPVGGYNASSESTTAMGAHSTSLAEALELFAPVREQCSILPHGAAHNLFQSPTSTAIRVDHIDESNTQVAWNVDARRLSSSDTIVVSPAFELPVAQAKFKMMLVPTLTSDRKGGASFRRANGRGSVQLKCEATSLEESDQLIMVTFSLADDALDRRRMTSLRGPVWHNFTQSGICALPRGQEEWDFNSMVDENTRTFAVIVDILHTNNRFSF